jgi:hypothetical protein
VRKGFVAVRLTKQSSCPAPSVGASGGGGGTRVWSRHIAAALWRAPGAPTYTPCTAGVQTFAQGANIAIKNFNFNGNQDALTWLSLPHDCPVAPTYNNYRMYFHTGPGGAGTVLFKCGVYVLDDGVANLDAFVVAANITGTKVVATQNTEYYMDFNNMTYQVGTPGPDKYICIRINRPLGDHAVQVYCHGLQVNVGIS